MTCKQAWCGYVAAAAEKHGTIYPAGLFSISSRPRARAFLGRTTAGVAVRFLFSFYFPFFFFFFLPPAALLLF